MSEHTFAWGLNRLRDAISHIDAGAPPAETEAWVAICHAWLSVLDILHIVETTMTSDPEGDR